MSVIAKKLKRTIIMLLVCALVAGSVPMNAFATEVGGETVAVEDVIVEEDVVEEDVVEEDVVKEDVVEEDVVEEDVVEEDIVEEDVVEEDVVEEDVVEEDVVEEDVVEEDVVEEDIVEEDVVEENIVEDIVEEISEVKTSQEVGLAEEVYKTIVFSDATDIVKYKLEENTGIKLADGKRNTYVVAASVEYIRFSVEIPENYEAVVKFDNNEQVTPLIKDEEGSKVYEVAVSELNEYQIIRLEDKLIDKTVKIYFDEDEVYLENAVVNGGIYWELVALGDGTEDTPARQTTVPYGTKLTLTLRSNENCKLTEINAGKTTTLKNLDTYTFTVEVKDDMDIRVKSKAIEMISIFGLDETEGWIKLETVKGVHTIDNYLGKMYIAEVYCGADRQVIEEAELWNGNKLAKSTAMISGDETCVVLGFNVDEIGTSKAKNLKLKIKTANGIAETSLSVLPEIVKVTVSGVKNGKLLQAADTTKEYAVSLTPKDAIRSIGVKVYADGRNVVEDAKITNEGKLLVQTTGNMGQATLGIYNTTTNEEIPGGFFDVAVTEPKILTIKPTAKVQSATNTEFTLSLGAKNVEIPTKGKVWYRVVAKPDPISISALGDDPCKNNLSDVTKYFEYKGTSQIETFKIGNIEEGAVPKAIKYNISVSFVQTLNGNEPSVDNIIFETNNQNYINMLKNQTTKAPYYETKITLKKGTTTVYTGQENVAVATPTFNKLTTYVDIPDENIKIQNKWGQELLENSGITAKYEDGKILVSVEDTAEAGEYNLVVTAKTAANTIMTSATIKFNVVYGINRINLVNMPTRLYKKSNAEASFKIIYEANHVFYNEYGYDGVVKPKTNKVNFTIVDINGEELSNDNPLKKFVTIKSGKVIVAKGYVLNGNEYDFFKIKAVANDYKGNETVVYSNAISITNQVQKYGELVFAKYVDGDLNNGYKIVARSDESVSIDDIQGTFAKVLKKGVEEKEVYAWDDFIHESNVVISSKNNNLMLDSTGYLSGIRKTAKNVEIAASALDGSGQNTKLTNLTINGTDEKLILNINYEDGYTPIDVRNVSDNVYEGTYYGPVRTQLVINVGLENGDYLFGKAPECSVDFNNTAKIIYSYESAEEGGYYYRIEPTGEVVEITLNQKGNKYKYTLTNASVIDVSSELKKVEVVGEMNQYYYNPIQLKISENKEYDGKYLMISPNLVELEKNNKYGDFIYSIQNKRIPINGNEAELVVESPYYAGSYKVYACVGYFEQDGDNVNFIALTKDKEITLKVNSTKRTNVSFKMNTSYTIDTAKGGYTMLTYTNGYSAYGCTEILNANIKGMPNKFRDYFELELVMDPGGYYIMYSNLKLKEGLSTDDIEYLRSKSAANDLTGWVKWQEQYVQIKVKVK